MLEINDITKSFDGNKVLSNISLKINDCETVGLMGESGCGKSTLAKIICGLYSQDSGVIAYNGSNSAFKQYRKKIQYIPQQPFSALDPRQTIGDALCEPLMYFGNGMNAVKARIYAKELLNQVWLDEGIMKRYPLQISGGQAQRVCIARALAMQPAMIIADESTAMLDAVTQACIIEIFKRQKKERRLTMLFVSHNYSLLNLTADRIYKIERKEIKEIEKNET